MHRVMVRRDMFSVVYLVWPLCFTLDEPQKSHIRVTYLDRHVASVVDRESFHAAAVLFRLDLYF